MVEYLLLSDILLIQVAFIADGIDQDLNPRQRRSTKKTHNYIEVPFNVCVPK